MNKEFVYITDKIVAVSNENGNLTLRKAEERMKDVLVTEDKLDSLNTSINCAKSGIAIEKATIGIINKWYWVMAGLGAITLVAAPLTLGLSAGLGLIAGWGAIGGASCLYGKHVQNDSHKRINGYKNEIKRARELKQNLVNNLQRDQEFAKEIELPHERVGEVVVIDDVKEFEHQERSLRNAFNKGYREKPKTLVKTKSPLLRNTYRK